MDIYIPEHTKFLMYFENDVMCCPRSIIDLSSKMGLGYIGPRVRGIVKSARFPVLITSSVFKPWKSIAVFFGGSANAVNSLKLGLRLARLSGLSLKMYTQLGNRSWADYESVIAERGLKEAVHNEVSEWRLFTVGDIDVNLYDVDHDALVILGAFGHGVIRDVLFASKMEQIQGTMPNNLLIVGPKYAAIH